MCLFLLLAVVSRAQGQLTADDLFRTATYRQTAVGAPLLSGYNLSSRVVMTSPDDFDTATLTFPGPGSSTTYTGYNAAGPYLNYQSGSYATEAKLNAAYPTGSYTTVAQNTGTNITQSTTIISSSATDYPLSVPTLTASSYARLQDVNVADSTVLNFNSLSPAAGISSALVYLYVVNPNNQIVYNPGDLPGSTTSITIPADTLQPNTDYTVDLFFSDRINSAGADGVADTLAFANVTHASLITTPLPSAAKMAVAGIGLCLLSRKRCSL